MIHKAQYILRPPAMSIKGRLPATTFAAAGYKYILITTLATALSLLGGCAAVDVATISAEPPASDSPAESESEAAITHYQLHNHNSQRYEETLPLVEISAAPQPTPQQNEPTPATPVISTDKLLLGDYIELRRHCDKLTQRMNQLYGQLYQLQNDAGKAALVNSMMDDELSEVRLAALDIALSRVRQGQPLADSEQRLISFNDKVRLCLDHHNSDIRAAAAILLAAQRDEKLVEMLIPRLESEQSSTVRAAYIMALGSMRDSRSTDAILSELTNDKASEATEAAKALVKLIDADVLSASDEDKAARQLLMRYDENAGIEFRTAAMALMRRLAKAEFVPLMQGALDDDSAPLQLEAIRGLGEMKVTAASGDIAKLTSDSDRGIRQAALETLGTLGATDTLDAVLKRTNPAIESDDAVRQRAWQSALELMAAADSSTLIPIVDSLSDRPDALDYRIQILEMLSSRLSDSPSQRIDIDIKLAGALLAAERPLQAAEVLEAVYNETTGHAKNSDIWLEWVNSLLAANDEQSLTLMQQPPSKQYFAKALRLLEARLAKLSQQENYQSIAILADQAAHKLSQQLSDEQTQSFISMAAQANESRLLADSTKVMKLSAQLASDQSSVSERAASELLTMGPRAIAPMISLMRRAVENENATLQQNLLNILIKLAPELTGFDLKADKAQKLQTITDWEKLHYPQPLPAAPAPKTPAAANSEAADN